MEIKLKLLFLVAFCLLKMGLAAKVAVPSYHDLCFACIHNGGVFCQNDDKCYEEQLTTNECSTRTDDMHSCPNVLSCADITIKDNN